MPSMTPEEPAQARTGVPNRGGRISVSTPTSRSRTERRTARTCWRTATEGTDPPKHPIIVVDLSGRRRGRSGRIPRFPVQRHGVLSTSSTVPRSCAMQAPTNGCPSSSISVMDRMKGRMMVPARSNIIEDMATSEREHIKHTPGNRAGSGKFPPDAHTRCVRSRQRNARTCVGGCLRWKSGCHTEAAIT